MLILTIHNIYKILNEINDSNLQLNILTSDSLGSTLVILDTNIHRDQIIFLQLLTIDEKQVFATTFFKCSS